ncbi:hypothetical protein [Myxococcus sp. AM011]|nr:hypothetical protein [Myxococcus sp. AM011]
MTGENIRNPGLLGFATQYQLRGQGDIEDCGEAVKARGPSAS